MGHKGCAAGWASDIWGSWRRGPNPISQDIVFFKSQLRSHNPSLCCSNWNPIPIFLLFFFHESQSQCTKSHFPASKKGKSQLPFYPFTTLTFTQLDWRLRGSIWNWVMYQSNRSFNISPGQPPGHLNFWKIFVQIPPSRDRKAVQMPHHRSIPSDQMPPPPGNFSVAFIMLWKLCM